MSDLISRKATIDLLLAEGMVTAAIYVERIPAVETIIRSKYYKGCRNCTHQIDVLRTCEWLEHGGDGQLHFRCPRWERRNNE